MRNESCSKRLTFYRVGFSLVELLVSLAIIALLLMIGSEVSKKVRNSARRAKAKADIEMINSAILDHLSKNGSLPSALADVDWSSGNRLAISNGIPIDPWGVSYVYTTNGPKSFVVYSQSIGIFD